MYNKEYPPRLTKVEALAPQAMIARRTFDNGVAKRRDDIANSMKKDSRRLLYIKLDDWTWWAWTTTSILLLFGLSGHYLAFIGAMAVTAGQGIVMFARDRSPLAFSFQLRAAYLLLLLICYLSAVRWLYWLPAAGTLALVTFGYCVMARLLSLLPWNSAEAYSWERLRRTFLSVPDLERVKTNGAAAGNAGGLCTIAAQIAPPRQRTESDGAANGSQPIPSKTNRTSSAAGFRR